MLIYCNLDFFHHDLVCTFDEFACWDGTCVQIDVVCNGKMDCNDKSDEMDCKSIKFDNAYIKNLPPSPFKTMSNEEKIPIWLDMIVLSVLELNEIQSMMKLQLELQAHWIDTRLEFINVKKREQRGNFVSLEEKKKLWLPSLHFANNKKKMKAMFEVDNSIGSIFLTENATFRLHPLFKTKIFSGKDG